MALPAEREAELRDAFDQFAIGGQLGFDESRAAELLWRFRVWEEPHLGQSPECAFDGAPGKSLKAKRRSGRSGQEATSATHPVVRASGNLVSVHALRSLWIS